MNPLKYLFTLTTIVIIMTACKNETTPEIQTVDFGSESSEKMLNPDAEYTAAEFEIDGMMCAMGCAKVIEKNLAKLDGVKTVEVDFDSKTAKIEYDEALVNPDLIMSSVKNTGDVYTVTSWNGEALSQPKENLE